jgi:hypothetical protein
MALKGSGGFRVWPCYPDVVEDPTSWTVPTSWTRTHLSVPTGAKHGARRSFATFCHEGPNTALQLATVHDDVERLAEENNAERQWVAIVSGLGGGCSIR